MANRQNTRRIAHVKRETRRDNRRAAAQQIRAGDYDNMASGQRMVRTTPTGWGDGSAVAPNDAADVRTPWEA